MFNKKGFTITGALIAIVLTSIMLLVGLDYHGRLRKSILKMRNKFIATNLANAQIEDLMNMAIGDPLLAAGNHPISTINQADIPQNFTITYDVANGDWPDLIDTDPLTGWWLIAATCTYNNGNESVRVIGSRTP